MSYISTTFTIYFAYGRVRKISFKYFLSLFQVKIVVVLWYFIISESTFFRLISAAAFFSAHSFVCLCLNTKKNNFIYIHAVSIRAKEKYIFLFKIFPCFLFNFFRFPYTQYIHTLTSHRRRCSM